MGIPPTSSTGDDHDLETPRPDGRGVDAPAPGYAAATLGTMLGAVLGGGAGVVVGFALGQRGSDVDVQLYAVILSVLGGTWLGSWLGCLLGLKARRHPWAGQTAALTAAAGPVWAFLLTGVLTGLDEVGLVIGVAAFALVPLGARAAVVKLHSETPVPAR